MRRIMDWFINRLRKAMAVGPLGVLLYVYQNPKIDRAKIRFFGRALEVRNNRLDIGVAMANAVDELPLVKNLFERKAKLNIVDAGAYIGTSTLLLNRFYPNSKIVSVEASRENYEMLEVNTESLLDKGVNILNKALVGNSDGPIEVLDRMTGTWGHTVIESPADQKNPQFVSHVETISLAEIRSLHFAGGPIDILKLDIEGAEGLLARDSPEQLIEAKVILMELHEGIWPGITEMVRSLLDGRKNFFTGEKILSVEPRLLG